MISLEMIPKRIFGWMVEERARTRVTPAYSSIKRPLKRLAFPGMGNLDPKYNPNKKNDGKRN